MNKYGKVIVPLALAIALAITIAIMTRPREETGWAGKPYANEAIEVIEGYKNYKLNATEAKNKLAYLSDELARVESELSNTKEKDALFVVSSWVSIIKNKLGFHGAVPTRELNEALQAIKKANSI